MAGPGSGATLGGEEVPGAVFRTCPVCGESFAARKGEQVCQDCGAGRTVVTCRRFRCRLSAVACARRYRRALSARRVSPAESWASGAASFNGCGDCEEGAPRFRALDEAGLLPKRKRRGVTWRPRRRSST